jgi:hypothetical protein
MSSNGFVLGVVDDVLKDSMVVEEFSLVNSVVIVLVRLDVP